ncbi:MAG: hypothetical protein WD059_11360 [Balneolaceae bacterium]
MIRKKEANHKLVVIGDSLSQGFNNGGIYRTDINFPSFLSNCLNSEQRFEQPRFTAQAGIPLNLEILVRGLSEEFGNDINWKEYLPAATHMFSTLRRIKRYWEGGLKDLAVDRENPYHNQSVWGFAINDSWIVNEENCLHYISNNRERFTVFDMLPEHAKFTTARLVLNPTFKKHPQNNQIQNVQVLQDDGGIENLIVCLGHNNIMGAATNLQVVWSEQSDLEAFPADRKHTVYRPEHFEQEYRKMAEKVSKIGAKRIFVPTIPYVTIPPVCRGVNSDLSSQRLGYFDYYTRFWIWDEEFDPHRHPHLTKDDAIHLDLTIDDFNSIIRSVAKEYGWTVVPMAKNVAAMARRRLGGETIRHFPPGLAKAIKKNPGTSHIVGPDGELNLTTDYIRLNGEGKLYKGGIFSLDGLHPTTIGYGLMANVYFQTMRQAGVKFNRPINWDLVVAEDSLVSNPPLLLRELRFVLRYLAMGNQERFFSFGKNILAQVMGLLSPGE